MKNVGFIFDSSYQIGGGHFWRCYNLAKALGNKNLRFFFVSNKLHKKFIELLNKDKFNYIKINKIENFSQIQKVIIKKKINIVISDFYKLSLKNKKNIKKLSDKLIVIDDHLNKKHGCDVYINNNFMNFNTKKKIKKLNPNTTLFLGQKYFIHNSTFLKIRKKKKNKMKIKNVFAFFGSSDPSNETFKFISAIEKFNNLNFKILIGKLNKNISKIRSYCKNKKNIKIFHDITNYSTLKIMQNTDFAFGSGGINLSERLFLGIPSVAICTASNQKSALIALKRKKIIHYLGSHKKINITKIRECMDQYLNNQKRYSILLNNTLRYYNKNNNFRFFINKLITLINKKRD